MNKQDIATEIDKALINLLQHIEVAYADTDAPILQLARRIQELQSQLAEAE